MRNLRRFFEKAFGRITITVIFMLLQLFWLLFLVFKLQDYYIYASSVVSALAVIMAVFVANKRDNPAYRMGWIMLILIVPVLGVLLYAMFGHSSITKRARKKYEVNEKLFGTFFEDDSRVIEEVRQCDRQVGNICRYISQISGYPIYRNEDLAYHKMGEEGLECLKEELKKAKEFIFMEYFIVEADGKTFGEIADILEAKVKEGVEVRFLYDDIGSVAYFDKKDLKRLQARGINVRRFNPMRSIAVAFMNNRDHRKITVIDGKVGFTGGYNLADEYANIEHPFGVWKDTGIVVRGRAVDSFTAMFLAMWNSAGKKDKSFDRYFKRCKMTEPGHADGYIQPYSDTPLDHERVGEDVYLNIIKTACDYVYIYTPYLIIDNEMMSELCLAAKSGVDVRIVTPGIPDKKIIYLLTQSYYSQLMDAGVKIYQYTPGFVHAKVFVSDDEIATVGTINLDFRSLYLHFECGAFMYKCKAIHDIKKDFTYTFSECNEVTQEFVKNRNIFVRGFQVMLRLFAPLM